jgi:hypothetical protein
MATQDKQPEDQTVEATDLTTSAAQGTLQDQESKPMAHSSAATAAPTDDEQSHHASFCESTKEGLAKSEALDHLFDSVQDQVPPPMLEQSSAAGPPVEKVDDSILNMIQAVKAHQQH